MLKVNDKVLIHFSHHTQEGIIRSIDPSQEYGYVVETKVYGKDTEVYCRASDLEVVTNG